MLKLMKDSLILDCSLRLILYSQNKSGGYTPSIVGECISPMLFVKTPPQPGKP